MSEIFNSLTDFLISTHGTRDVHGYSYVLALMSVWAAYYGAKTVKEKKQQLKDDLEGELAANISLSAVIIHSVASGVDRWEGKIVQSQNGYKVTVLLNDDQVAEEDVSSWEGLEHYLKNHTKFLISDFK